MTILLIVAGAIAFPFLIAGALLAFVELGARLGIIR